MKTKTPKKPVLINIDLELFQQIEAIREGCSMSTTTAAVFAAIRAGIPEILSGRYNPMKKKPTP